MNSNSEVMGAPLNPQPDPEVVLTDRLRAAASRGTNGLIYLRTSGAEVSQSYAELESEARRIAAGLRAAGVVPGDFVLLQLEQPEDFLPGLWGCITAAAVPVPVAVAPTFTHPGSALQKLVNAGHLLERARILASGAAVAGLRALPARLGTLSGQVLDLDELRRHAAVPATEYPRPAATDVAVMLLTSGSTGKSKGVPLTHRNLLAMAAGTVQANAFTEREVTLNWMALDHAGAVSFLGTMATDLGCTQIHVPTAYILQEPLRWLDLISRHRATISWAPNFAFTLFLDRSAAVGQGSWDLSCMRFLVNAGESVVARTARRFIALLQRHGLPADALRPAFGMSETCSGITWSRGLTLENTSDDEPFVSLGPCIPGASMRIVNDHNEVLPEGHEGLLQLRGPSVFSGYFRNPIENAQVFSHGWFTTGDLAFIRGDCMHISGRMKDVIIVNGANFYCHEIEAVAESVPGLSKTFTAACAVREPGAETDQLALFFCLENETPEARTIAARSLRAKLIQEAGVPASFLIAVRPSDIPKTEIGKIQRSQLRKAFEAGAFKDRVVSASRSGEAAARQRAGKVKNRAELTAAIARIWQEELGLESVGYDETFFELGGHSLLVVRVQNRLQELMGRPVPVVELFNCPTVRTMAEHFAKELPGEEKAHDLAPAAAAELAAGGGGDIAIIGIGLRFPGASTPDEFWRVLAEGRETIRTFTAEEALAAGVDPEIVRNPNHVRAAPMLEAPEAFDADFFRYNAKDARLIDPQQRVFLEVCWEAFEDAGYDPLTYPGKVGLFAAAGLNTYLANNLLANPGFLQAENGGRMLTVDSMSGFNVMITNDKDYLPTRVSYKLNLRGPSVNVQSACSSTLLTLHQACNSLRAGDCAMALAGGVSIKLPQHAGHLYSAGMLNSPDGHCRAYDEKAEGTIFGNGAGVVILKPLAAALADRDRIYAVVKGTAANNDGGGKVGYTAPSAAGEEDVCAEALRRAGVSADTITFLEGHGTGTALGDPIEVNALASAFRRHTERTGFCALGSVKTNVGHLQIASGIAGLIKTVLALHHRQIPGTIHFEKPNPRIDFARTPFFVNRELIPWEPAGSVRRAGVNSLGIGGTNVHVILEEAPAAAAAGDAVTGTPEVLPLSARSVPALRQMARRYAEALAPATGAVLSDIAFTAQVGRAALTSRVAFVGTSVDEWVRQLRAFAEGATNPPGAIDFDQRGLAWVFSDASGSDPAVWRQLDSTERVFRERLDHVLEVGEKELGASVREGIDTWRSGTAVWAPNAPPRNVAFALQMALAELLASFGIEPAALGGEGVGEYIAACRAGVFSLEDAWRLVTASPALPGDTALAEYRAAVARATLASPNRRLFSAAGGAWVEAKAADPEHWLALPAQIEAGAGGTMTGFPVVVDLGLGDSRWLNGAAGQVVSARDFPRLLATLFTLGYPIQWAKGRPARPGRRVALPTYPWQHQSYWIEGTDLLQWKAPGAAPTQEGLLGRAWSSPRVRERVYESHFDPATLPLLAEHRVHGQIVVPGAWYLAQVSMQAEDIFRRAGSGFPGAVELSEVIFVAAMVVEPGRPRTVQTVFTPGDDGSQRFEVISWTEAEPERVFVHATGRTAAARRATGLADLAAWRARPTQAVAVENHDAVMNAMAVGLGPSFRWITAIHAAPGEAWTELERPEGIENFADWHPGLVDSWLQAAVDALGLDGSQTLIPFRVERLVLHGRPSGARLFARAERDSSTGGNGGATVRSALWLYEPSGELRAEVSGFELRSLAAEAVRPDAREAMAAEFLETAWEPLAEPPQMAVREAGAWLVVAHASPGATALAQALRNAGESVMEVSGTDAGRVEELHRAQSWRGVVHAWSAETAAPAKIDWRLLLACVQNAATGHGGAPARWIFVTESPRHSPALAPLAGFVAGLAHELPEWRPLHLAVESLSTGLERCVPWLLAKDSSEQRLVLRDGALLAARLHVRELTAPALPIRADGTYLITGGAGALGLAVAEWLVEQGAREIVLCGRREAPGELSARLAAWEGKGVRATYERANVGEADSVRRLVAGAGRRQPLRGVFHAAGTLRDGLVRQAEAPAFGSVFESKIAGAWALHEATSHLPLDCFVLFSSIASLLGSPGQANYAAGNAFLDALALYRRSVGLPAVSIQWGPWAGGGMTARLGARDWQRVVERGLLPMAPAIALPALGRVLGAGLDCVGVLGWNRAKYRAALGDPVPPFYARIFGTEPLAPAPRRESDDGNLAILPLAERTEAIERLIREAVAAVLGLESYRGVNRETGLFDQGIDSLTAIDLKVRLEKTLGQPLRTTVAFDYPTPAAMAAHLAVALFPPAGAPASGAPAGAADLEAMAAADVAALLEKELKL